MRDSDAIQFRERPRWPQLVLRYKLAHRLGDRRRLQRAFRWTASAILVEFRQVAGDRSGRVLVERFNNYALAAGWRVSIAQDRAEDYLPGDMGLIERGEQYALALVLFLDLVAGEIGERGTVRALQRAYDGLPWEEREIAGQYLFVHVDRARALSREFEALHRDYAALVCRVPLFATMSREEIELLVARLRLERHPAGRRIIRQGERGDRFYIVRQGHVEVTQRDAAGVTSVVNQLDRGDYFGEVALLHPVLGGIMMVVVLAFRNGKGIPRLMRGLTSRTRWRRAWKYSTMTAVTNWAMPRVRL